MKNYITERTSANKRDVEGDILVEGGIHAIAIPAVVVTTVHEEELDQMVELADDVVCVVNRGIPLLALHTHAHRTLPNHRNIVRTVADGQTAQALILHQHNNAALLLGTHTTANHRRGVLNRETELVLRKPDEEISRNAI